MEGWIISACVLLWLCFMYLAEKVEQTQQEERVKEFLGMPIEQLKDGAIYHQCPPPDNLVFLSKDEEKPKTYALNFDVKKLPNSFMYLEKKGMVVSWNPIDLYVHPEDQSPDEDVLSDKEIIELEELSDKQPA